VLRSLRLPLAWGLLLGFTSLEPVSAYRSAAPHSRLAFTALAERPALVSAAPASELGVVLAPALESLAPALVASGGLAPSAPAAAVLEAAAPAPADDALDLIAGSLPRGGTLSKMLLASGVPRPRVRELTKALGTVFDLRSAERGDSFLLSQRADGELVSFRYQHGRSDLYELTPDGSGALAVKHSLSPAELRVAHIGGVIQKSLTRSLLAQGERADLVDQFTDIFVWQVDFAQESQPGDEYRMVVEKFYDAQGFVRYGKILAAQYVTPELDLTAVYYENRRGHSDYFTPTGRSLRRGFLRAPLRFTRISSGYAKTRLHPVLNRPIPHEAIDYAAPVGTPVWAVADGVVTQMTWMGGLGRTVVVRHGNGCSSYYGHLSRYGEDLRRGRDVRQRHVLGYVGRSGLATGPHLDFRVKCSGRWIDPSRMASGPEDGQPVRMEELFAFEKLKRVRLEELRQAHSPLILEAAM
jgi:murein DD-endopeptidase MepM/ murein hydrolase activator NlpD